MKMCTAARRCLLTGVILLSLLGFARNQVVQAATVPPEPPALCPEGDLKCGSIYAGCCLLFGVMACTGYCNDVLYNCFLDGGSS